MTRITQQNLESYLWGAAVLLRGTIDAGDYKQFIFPLLFYKRHCDVFDEETVTALRETGGDQDFALFPENHRFQVPADAHWREIRKVTRERAQSSITDEHLQRVVHAYQDFKDKPGFTRVVPIEEIWAKECSLNITLYDGGETPSQTDAATESAATALPDALTQWLYSARELRRAIAKLG